MASTYAIRGAIKQIVGSITIPDYSAWTIGITTDPETRKEAHGNPPNWKIWTADSLAIAREIETYFLNDFPAKKSERMKGGTGGDMDENETAYVYIF